MMRGDSLFTWDKFNDTEDIRLKAMQSASAGGPNSGFEMPDVDYFKQPELANELPDMKDDIDLIISTEAYVRRLVDFHDRMMTQKGMSRGMAYELIELVPDLESFVKPNGFTEVISGVGYQPSLESISSQMWVVIAAAAAVLAALIYKFTSWLFGGGSNGNSGSGSLEKAEEGIRESEKKVDAQERVLEKTASTVQSAHGKTLEVKMPAQISHDEIRRSSMPEGLKNQILKEVPDLVGELHVSPDPQHKHFLKINLIDVLTGVEGGSQVLEYMRKPSRYARVVFQTTRSPAMELITASFEGFNSYSQIMMSELSTLEEAFAFGKEMRSGFSEGGGKDYMASIDKERTALRSLADASGDKPASFKIGSKTFMTAGEWAQALKDSIHDEGSKEPNFNDLEELLGGYHAGVRRLKEVNWRGMITFIELLKKSQPALEQLEKLSKDYELAIKRGSYDAKDEEGRARNNALKENANAIITLQRDLTQNYVGLMRVYSEISRVYTEVTKNAAEVVNTLRKNANGIVALYNKVGEMVPPSLEELADDLSDLSKAANESRVNQHMLPFVSISHMKVSFGGSDDEEGPSVTMSAEDAAKSLRILTGKGE